MSASFRPLDPEVERLIRGRYESLLLSARELVELGVSKQRLDELSRLLDRFYSPDDPACPFCSGSGLDDDPGMTRFYAEKDLRARGWQAPAEPVYPEAEEQSECARRGWQARYLRLLDDAWEIVGAPADLREFHRELLAASVLAEAASEEALRLQESRDESSNLTICNSCQGSGRRQHGDSYIEPWAARHGWQPAVVPAE